MNTYSDRIYENILQSLQRFLGDHPSLKGVDVRFSEEFEPTRGYTKPFLLLSDKTIRRDMMGIDGGFWRDDLDAANGRVDTIYAKLARPDITLDLGTDTVADRRKWAAILDRVFEDASEAGIPVYNLAESGTSAEVGRMRYSIEDALSHNLLPEQPAVRTWRDVISFEPDYLHLFVSAAGQPQLTGVELSAREVSLELDN